jgi:hypothetical protein
MIGEGKGRVEPAPTEFAQAMPESYNVSGMFLIVIVTLYHLRRANVLLPI